MTHDQLTSAINGILGFRGQRIGFPDGRYYNECTAVVAHLHNRLGIPLPSMFGARADGWGVQFPSELAPYYRHEAYQMTKAYPYGTLLLWNSPHIAIVLSHDGGNMVQVFQQNADPNGAPCEVFNRVVNNQFHTCTYALIPIIQEPAQAPLWTVTPMAPKQVKVKPGSHKWNLALRNFDEINANDITTAQDNEVFTAVAVLHHREIPQYNYYLEDANTPHGWNVLDCGDYNPPPPPYVPPAAPAKFIPADTYPVIVKLMAFPSALDAKMERNYEEIDIEPGTYYVWSTDGNAKLLGKDNMKRPEPETWVNTDKNIKPLPVIAVPTLPVDPPPIPAVEPVDPPQPVPAAQKPSFYWIHDDRTPVLMKLNTSLPILATDLNNPDNPKQPIPAGWQGSFSMYTQIGAVTYYVPDISRNKGWFYGLNKDLLRPVKPATLDRNRDGKVTISDFTDGLQPFIDYTSKLFSGSRKLLSDITPQTKQSARQLIDGINKRKAK